MLQKYEHFKFKQDLLRALTLAFRSISSSTAMKAGSLTLCLLRFFPTLLKTVSAK